MEVEQRKYSYLWKVFDISGDKTFQQVHDSHPYCTNPLKSLSNHFSLTNSDRSFLFFHLADLTFGGANKMTGAIGADGVKDVYGAVVYSFNRTPVAFFYIVANILQGEAWNNILWSKIGDEQPVLICALPLYHIFGFNTNMMLSMHMGGANVLIPNPRDLPAMFKELSAHRFHSFPAVNTLFMAMANHPEFGTVDWSHLVISVGGGMAVQQATAKLWLEKTGCPIVEGYGLSETSPTASCNPTDSTAYSGSAPRGDSGSSAAPPPRTYSDQDREDIEILARERGVRNVLVDPAHPPLTLLARPAGLARRPRGGWPRCCARALHSRFDIC